MARNKLTDSRVKAAVAPGVYGDGDGLYLRVQKSGGKSWIFIWRRCGVRREIGLGRYGAGAGHVSLAIARGKADEARLIVGAGGDPKVEMAERQAANRAPTFGEVVAEYIETMAPKWRGAKTVAAWQRFATTYTKALSQMPVDQIVTDDVVQVLRTLWHSKPETATKVRDRIRMVLDHAKARGLRQGDNPATWKGHLDQILPTPSKLKRGHHAAMPYVDVPALIAKLRNSAAVGARALEFTVLTAARSGETRAATWDEIDTATATWTIPAHKMKSGKVHRVPLGERAVTILAEAKARSEGDHVFPGQRSVRPLSDMTLLKALHAAAGDGFTVHGFRSSFRDWVGEATTFQREVAEAALAHAVGDETERAYRRGDALEKRRELMKAWEGFLNG
ncbi:integrase arm-type DNA-binding domain-containing protein [Sphingobium sp. SA2]|uniref:tyrosine-type recombinase/integrase n=1 Tax=Sphingobium sp. SA2 TaxID=1524832 RepID=UPI0028BFA8E1|nr:integrase arm-type DNA-binding domain-containing protein [Sphingobium sp. SA2]MDT7536180.1 integrase arm-type DNA-binding domain-containing protein [Sphingobium sp. SA2]